MSQAFAEIVATWPDPDRAVSVYQAQPHVSQYTIADALFKVERGEVIMPAAIAAQHGLKRLRRHEKVAALGIAPDGDLLIIEHDAPARSNSAGADPSVAPVEAGAPAEAPTDATAPADASPAADPPAVTPKVSRFGRGRR